jgi:drug/metabolite transporter (DMT)-like permease
MGLGAAILGFVYLVLPGVDAPDPLGALLMAMSGAAWGSFSLLARDAGDPVEANATNFLCCLLPAVLVNVSRWPTVEVTAAGVALATASGAIASGLGYIVWYLALRELPATRAATVQLSMPAIVALGGAAFLSEPLTWRLLIASVATLGGIALVLGKRAHPRP